MSEVARGTMVVSATGKEFGIWPRKNPSVRRDVRPSCPFDEEKCRIRGCSTTLKMGGNQLILPGRLRVASRSLILQCGETEGGWKSEHKGDSSTTRKVNGNGRQ